MNHILMKTPARFIVVDDNLINNLVCRTVIKSVAPQVEIETFSHPEKGFAYIEKEYADSKTGILTVLLLDINMPVWTGWDFLDNFEKLESEVKDQIKIYMLSSSVDERDIERARSNQN